MNWLMVELLASGQDMFHKLLKKSLMLLIVYFPSSPHWWMEPFPFLLPTWTRPLLCCSRPAPTSPDASRKLVPEGMRTVRPSSSRSRPSWSLDEVQPDWAYLQLRLLPSFQKKLELHSEDLLSKKSIVWFVCLLQGPHRTCGKTSDMASECSVSLISFDCQSLPKCS